jgi:ElaB/YqjD/DUF883 family membrane-anchored ribosome-binding protein
MELWNPEELSKNMDIPRSREDVREDLESITDQISEGLEKGRYTMAELQRALVDRTKQCAQTTDRVVHDHPWESIGVAVLLGVVVGSLLLRR